MLSIETRPNAVIKMPLSDHQVPGYFLRAIFNIPGVRVMPQIRKYFPSGQHVTSVGFPLIPTIERGVHLMVEGFKQINNALIPANVTGNWDDRSVVDRVQTNLMEIGSVLRGESEPDHPQYLRPSSKIFHFLTLLDARQDDITTWYNPEAPEDEEFDFIGEANYARLFAEMLKGPGHSDGVVTMDLHSRRAAKRFDEVGLPHINISAVSEFVKWLKKNGYTKDDSETMIASSDYGDLTRTLELSTRTGIKIGALIHKRREDQHLIAALEKGNVNGKKVIIWDDMISSAGTLKRDIELLLDKEGAKEVIFLATHPIFVGQYRKNIEDLKSKYGERVKIVVSNSLVVEKERMPLGVEKIDVTLIIKETAKVMLESESFEEARTRLTELGFVHDLLSPDDAMRIIKKSIELKAS